MPHAALCVLGQPVAETKTLVLWVSMPHAALCVLGRTNFAIIRNIETFQCRTQHCVCWDVWMHSSRMVISSFNAARSIVCVGTIASRSLTRASSVVSMPHAALCVLGQSKSVSANTFGMFQCRTQHCVCWDKNIAMTKKWRILVSMPHAALCVLGQISRRLLVCRDGFQCRTQHCVCWDTVSRSPCPARAEKAFWKDALFCAVFGVCG